MAPRALRICQLEGSRFLSLTLTQDGWEASSKCCNDCGRGPTPYTVNPRSIKASEMATLIPQPMSRTVAPPGKIWDNSTTTEAPTLELVPRTPQCGVTRCLCCRSTFQDSPPRRSSVVISSSQRNVFRHIAATGKNGKRFTSTAELPSGRQLGSYLGAHFDV